MPAAGHRDFVQWRTAAQGKDDLPLLPQHLRMLHNDLPEAGRKCRVHHELRPQLGNEWFHKWYSLFIQHKLPHPFFAGVAAKNVVFYFFARVPLF